MNRKTTCETEGFPRFITDLPEADIQFKSVREWISQGDDHQVVFFDIAAHGEVTEHYHETPQWGAVVEGEMELTIDGETKVYRKAMNIAFQPEPDTRQCLEADSDQLTSSAKKIDTDPKKSCLKRDHIQLVLGYGSY